MLLEAGADLAEAMALRASSLVHDFLLGAENSFFASESSILRIGAPGTFQERCNAGDLALWKGCQVVYVERAVRRPRWSNISAAIDGDPYFAKGPVPSDGFLVWDEPSAWHVVRVHNFCRVMGASCEPVGSRMTALWESHGHPSISRLRDAVVLKDADLHFLGTARYEYVIRAVGAVLGSLGMKPGVSPRWHQERDGCEKPKVRSDKGEASDKRDFFKAHASLVLPPGQSLISELEEDMDFGLAHAALEKWFDSAACREESQSLVRQPQSESL